MDAHRTITPDEIVHATFSTTRFRPGYDQDEVDDHLDAVVEVMRAHMAGRDTSHLPTSTQVAEIAFTQTRLRDGYDPHEVDDLLLQAQRALAELERRSATR